MNFVKQNEEHFYLRKGKKISKYSSDVYNKPQLVTENSPPNIAKEVPTIQFKI